jgi:hypothetical protein
VGAASRREESVVWYRFSDDEVVLVTVTTDPPVPTDE